MASGMASRLFSQFAVYLMSATVSTTYTEVFSAQDCSGSPSLIQFNVGRCPLLRIGVGRCQQGTISGCTSLDKLPLLTTQSDALITAIATLSFFDSSCAALVSGFVFAANQCVAVPDNSIHLVVSTSLLDGSVVVGQYKDPACSNTSTLLSLGPLTTTFNASNAPASTGGVTACTSATQLSLSTLPLYSYTQYFSDSSCTSTIRFNATAVPPTSICMSNLLGCRQVLPDLWLQLNCKHTPTILSDAAAWFSTPYLVIQTFKDPFCVQSDEAYAEMINLCYANGDLSRPSYQHSVLANGSWITTFYARSQCQDGVIATQMYVTDASCSSQWIVKLMQPDPSAIAARTQITTTIQSRVPLPTMIIGPSSAPTSTSSNFEPQKPSNLAFTPLQIGVTVAGSTLLLFLLSAVLYLYLRHRKRGDRHPFSIIEFNTLSSSSSSSSSNSREPSPQRDLPNQGRRRFRRMRPSTSSAPVVPEKDLVPLLDEKKREESSFLDAALHPLGYGTASTPSTNALKKRAEKSKGVAQWSVEEVAQWLVRQDATLETARLVRDQDVTGHVLLKLTRDEMRRDLAISSVQTLSRVQEAIAQLNRARDGGSDASVGADGGAVLLPMYDESSLSKSEPALEEVTEIRGSSSNASVLSLRVMSSAGGSVSSM
ncbi:hypothetical protein BC830DRAFT_345296 [Chytriomyces sp. MP71]|nr:hypothetical protein BC830DRAFT_345296 [Chytriomyces sp. MP71]